MAGDLAIAVASHKPYWMPPDPCYRPVWVGAALRGGEPPEGWSRDDSCEPSLSGRNEAYCELTALWWAWRSLDAGAVGLAHYRRHLSRGPFGNKRRDRVARSADVLARLGRAPLVLPSPRDYVIETNYSQYAHAHHAKDLDEAREVLRELSPEVVPAWDASMRRTSGHRFNMLVARRDVLDAWCSFLFPVLAELEHRIDTTGYSANDRRVLGFVAERLLDPWVEANGVPYVEMPVVNLEGEHWPRKAAAFLGRKMRGERE